MGIKLIRTNEGFSPDAIKRFTVDDPNYVSHIVIPDKKNGDDVIVKIVRGTHRLFSGPVYYGRALRSSAKEPFSTGMGSLELMTDWLDGLSKQDPEVALARLNDIEKSASKSKTHESLGGVTRNNGRYKEAFMIDCGTPENALALADAISKEAYDHPAGSKLDDAGRHFLGGEIIQSWPVGRFFTAAVDPCEKAIEWCQNFLKNLGGAFEVSGTAPRHAFPP